MVQWRLTGLQPTQAISSLSTEDVSIFSLTPVWPTQIKDSQPPHTYVQKKKTRERCYWTLVRVELIPSNKDLINCREACCSQRMHSENGESLRKRKKAKTKQNKNKQQTGPGQNSTCPSFPHPYTLSYIPTRREWRRNNWWKHVFTHSQRKWDKAGGPGVNRTPSPESAAKASSSWWQRSQSINLGSRPIWVCILIPHLGTVRPRKEVSTSWAFTSPTCKLL